MLGNHIGKGMSEQRGEGNFRCMACGLVFSSEADANSHEEQHPGMVRRAPSPDGQST